MTTHNPDRPASDEPTQPEVPAPTPSATPGRFQSALLTLLLGVLLLVGGKLYLDGYEAAVALEPFPQIPPTGPDFDLSQATIPKEQIMGGGPPKDGIPALSSPKYVKADQAQYLRPEDRIAGVFIEGQARAYPLRILNWHEVVNDEIGGQPFAMTYCPLCDSVAVFDRLTPEGVKEFGVSGLLYNSNVLMYDREGEPEALWTQLGSEAVSGPRANQNLKTLPVELTTWADWRKRHPETLVLSHQTGHPRDYGNDPYAGYFQQPGLMFPVQPTSSLLPQKEKVLGVRTPDGSAKAYPLSAFAQAKAPVEVADEIGGHKVSIQYDPEAKSLRVVEADEGVEWMYSLWFAWYAFHPETTVYGSR